MKNQNETWGTYSAGGRYSGDYSNWFEQELFGLLISTFMRYVEE